MPDLTTRQKRAIAQLLSTQNVAEAAKAAGVSKRSLFRWLTVPAFRAALLAAEGDAIDAATRRLLTLQDRAIDTINKLLDGATVPDEVKLRAARTVLEAMLRLRTVRSIEERISSIEEELRMRKGGDS